MTQTIILYDAFTGGAGGAEEHTPDIDIVSRGAWVTDDVGYGPLVLDGSGCLTTPPLGEGEEGTLYGNITQNPETLGARIDPSQPISIKLDVPTVPGTDDAWVYAQLGPVVLEWYPGYGYASVSFNTAEGPQYIYFYPDSEVTSMDDLEVIFNDESGVDTAYTIKYAGNTETGYVGYPLVWDAFHQAAVSIALGADMRLSSIQVAATRLSTIDPLLLNGFNTDSSISTYLPPFDALGEFHWYETDQETEGNNYYIYENLYNTVDDYEWHELQGVFTSSSVSNLLVALAAKTIRNFADSLLTPSYEFKLVPPGGGYILLRFFLDENWIAAWQYEILAPTGVDPDDLITGTFQYTDSEGSLDINKIQMSITPAGLEATIIGTYSETPDGYWWPQPLVETDLSWFDGLASVLVRIKQGFVAEDVDVGTIRIPQIDLYELGSAASDPDNGGGIPEEPSLEADQQVPVFTQSATMEVGDIPEPDTGIYEWRVASATWSYGYTSRSDAWFDFTNKIDGDLVAGDFSFGWDIKPSTGVKVQATFTSSSDSLDPRYGDFTLGAPMETASRVGRTYVMGGALVPSTVVTGYTGPRIVL